jgi:hypothetical protein
MSELSLVYPMLALVLLTGASSSRCFDPGSGWFEKA